MVPVPQPHTATLSTRTTTAGQHTPDLRPVRWTRPEKVLPHRFRSSDAGASCGTGRLALESARQHVVIATVTGRGGHGGCCSPPLPSAGCGSHRHGFCPAIRSARCGELRRVVAVQRQIRAPPPVALLFARRSSPGRVASPLFDRGGPIGSIRPFVPRKEKRPCLPVYPHDHSVPG